MDDGVLSVAIHPNRFSPDYVFRDYCARRTGIVRALTEDVEDFYEQCDPDKEDLGLHGLPDETWEMRLPAEEVPPELPEPVSGINFSRDGMSKKDWLALVAVHSDAWLMSLAFYFAGRLAFDREARTQLFMKINGISTVLEAVTAYKRKLAMIPNGSSKKKLAMIPNGSNKKKLAMIPNGSSKNKLAMIPNGSSKKKLAMIPNGSSKNKPALSKPPRPSNPTSNPPMKTPLPTLVEENGAREDGSSEDQGITTCGACMEAYASTGFWICCDICEKWFHGKCVRVTADMADEMKLYMCPGCRYRSRRSREPAPKGSG